MLLLSIVLLCAPLIGVSFFHYQYQKTFTPIATRAFMEKYNNAKLKVNNNVFDDLVVSKSSSMNRELSRKIRTLSVQDLNRTATFILTCIDDNEKKDLFDHVTIAATIASCQRLSLFHTALSLFYAMQRNNFPIDAITIKSAARAAVLSGQIRDILFLLDISHRKGDSKETSSCLAAAIESVAYCKSTIAVITSVISRLKSWAIQHGYWEDPYILEKFVFVTCKYGLDSETSIIVQNLFVDPKAMSTRAITALLGRYCHLNDRNGIELTKLAMNKLNISKDTVICNIFLEHYSSQNETRLLLQTLEEIVQLRLQINHVTKTLLQNVDTTLFSSEEKNKFDSLLSALQVNLLYRDSHFLCRQISKSQTSLQVTNLLLEAQKIGKEDTPLTVAAALQLASLDRDYDRAIAVIESYAERTGQSNNNLLRAVAKLAVDAAIQGGDHSNWIVRLDRFVRRHGDLVVSDVVTVNYVLNLVSNLNDALLLLVFRRKLFPAACLPSGAVARLADMLLRQQSAVSCPVDILGESHSNLVEELLLYLQFVVVQMRDNGGKWQGWSPALLESATKRLCNVAPVAKVKQAILTLQSTGSFRPTGVMLFDLSQYFREQDDTEGSAMLLAWMSTSKKMLAPRPLINALIAHLYSAGEKDRAVTLFQQYTATHNIEDEWEVDSSDNRPTLDLHYKSRGMAYVLLITSLKGIIQRSLFAGHDGVRIITGKSLSSTDKRRKEDYHIETAAESKWSPYRLSDEVQRILIEEFYPPIASSTEPGNPGRILVRLADIQRSSALMSLSL